VAFASARSGVLAAAQAHERLASHDWGGHPAVVIRIGVHTGTPERGDEGYWGADVHYGARLGAAAHGGQTLLSAAAAAQVGDVPLRSVGEHAFKDYPDPLEVFEAVDGHPAGHFPPPRSLRRPGPRLPTVTSSFVGREQELADLVGAITSGARLVTLVGPGGSGKTRLALEAAHLLAGEQPDVWFVALEGVADPDDLETTIARSLGLPEEDDATAQLTAYLADRSAVLVLDNLEHVIEAAPRVAALAAGAPGLRVLVTSQATMRVTGEQVVRLGPLGTPAEDDDLATSDAVRLLLDRTRTAGHPLELTAENRHDVGELVRCLEGMPLAIELAAARLGLATPGSLVRRLDQGLDALGSGARDLPARQRGLLAVLDWTCGLLAPAERDLLAGLTSFADDVDPEVVDLAFPGAFDGLSALLDVGLVTRTGARLALRPPVRRYAASLVDDARSADQHRSVVRALATLAEPYEGLWMMRFAEGNGALRHERANLVAALAWAREHDPDGHAELTAAAGWWLRDLSITGRAHVVVALDRVTDPRLRARLLAARGALSLDDPDPEACVESAAYWGSTGVVDRQAVNLAYASNLLDHRVEDPGRALRMSGLAVRLLEQDPLADPLLVAVVRTIEAQALWQNGRRDEALAIQTGMQGLVGTDPWIAFWLTTGLADMALDGGRPADAMPLYGRCLRWALEFDSNPGALIQACTIAQALLDLGRPQDGTLAWAVCAHVHRELGNPMRAVVDRILATVEERIELDLVPASRTRAAELGVAGGLAWLEEIALTDAS
jgi:predicted ATPase